MSDVPITEETQNDTVYSCFVERRISEAIVGYEELVFSTESISGVKHRRFRFDWWPDVVVERDTTADSWIGFLVGGAGGAVAGRLFTGRQFLKFFPVLIPAFGLMWAVADIVRTLSEQPLNWVVIPLFPFSVLAVWRLEERTLGKLSRYLKQRKQKEIVSRGSKAREPAHYRISRAMIEKLTLTSVGFILSINQHGRRFDCEYEVYPAVEILRAQAMMMKYASVKSSKSDNSKTEVQR